MFDVSSTLLLPAPPLDGDSGPIPPSQVTEQQNRHNGDQNEALAAVATHTRTIGIIHPPPHIRNIVDKTSQFIAKNGPALERKILANNAGNQNFNFLIASDPYHAYYQHRLSEFRAQNQNSAQREPDNGYSNPNSGVPDIQEQFRSVAKLLVPPEPNPYIVPLPEGITCEELDVIRLTTQFVARNGINFLNGLTAREYSNPLFNFLEPNHSMFDFVCRLTDAYSKVLMPPKGLSDKLQASVAYMTKVLERCLNRLEWERLQEQARQKAEDEIEQDRIQMAMIDWQDFVVVESIEFSYDEDEDLPRSMTLEEVIRRSKIITNADEEIIFNPSHGVCNRVDSNEDDKKHHIHMMVDDDVDPMRIVKNWKRPEDRLPADRDPTKYVVSLITGELIAINEMSEHMRISLIDPKFKEQKYKMFAKIKDTTLAQDDEISRNIVGLARTRPDIFGTTEEEVSNAVMAEIENKKKKDEQPKQVIWDDSNQTLPGPAAAPPRPVILPVRPLPPPGTLQYYVPTSGAYPQYAPRLFGAPGGMSMMPPPPPPSGMPLRPPPEEASPSLPEEPEPKRQKLDESSLVPEDQFLAQNSGPARISVSVPNIDEGNLKGQVLEIIVQSLSETIGSLKEKIAGEIQLPLNKQKLNGKPGFLKDNLSLAHYNIGNGESLALSLRERGGRKK